MISISITRKALLWLAILFSLPGAFFGILWLGAHAFSNLVGPLVYVYPGQERPDSEWHGLIFLLAGTFSLVELPVCIVATASGILLVCRGDVSGRTKFLAASLVALSIVGTAWVGFGMP